MDWVLIGVCQVGQLAQKWWETPIKFPEKIPLQWEVWPYTALLVITLG